MSRGLSGVAASGIEGKFLNRTRRRKTLRVSDRAGEDLAWIVPKSHLVTIGAEEEKSAQFGQVDIVGTEFHLVTTDTEREVVSELILSDERLLRNVHVLPDLDFRGAPTAARILFEADFRIGCHTTVFSWEREDPSRRGADRVDEVLKLNCKRVDLVWRDNVVVRDHHAMKLVDVAVGLRQVRDEGIAELVIRVCPLLASIPQIGALLVGNLPVAPDSD